MIDFYLPKGDINKLERDPYAHIREQRTRIAALEAENERLRDALRSAAVVLPKYAMKGATTGDDEALDAVIEQVGEALEAKP